MSSGWHNMISFTVHRKDTHELAANHQMICAVESTTDGAAAAARLREGGGGGGGKGGSKVRAAETVGSDSDTPAPAK